MASIDQIKADFQSKISKLQKVSYPQYFGQKTPISKLIEMEGEAVTISGRIMIIRGHGGLLFMVVVDVTSQIQCMFKEDVLSKDLFDLVRLLDIGDIIAVTGQVGKSKTGQLSVIVEDFSLLTKAIRPLPEKWHGLTDAEERYRMRYVDMIVNSEVKNTLKIRSEISKFLRNYLEGEEFIEVETPILQPLYGGASARPFKTFYNEMDADFYLRIADELYLKRLIVGGFEKVYEIGKDFRNEGVSKAHNPEFTQLEFYWAYKTYEDLMSFTENMLEKLVLKLYGNTKIVYDGSDYDFVAPFPRKSFSSLFVEYLQIDLDQPEDDLIAQFKVKKLLTKDMEGYGYRDAVDNVYKKHIRPFLSGPMFIVDYPASMLPLAKPLSTNPALAGSFQLLVAGMEVVKAYDELNDPILLRSKWEEEKKLEKKGSMDSQPIDEDFLMALEYGMPPTAGWGMGIDRITALLTDNHHIKEVIAFPTLRPR